jgi:integrase-like protein
LTFGGNSTFVVVSDKLCRRPVILILSEDLVSTSSYRRRNSPVEVAEEENRKAYATQDTYEGYLKKWILPRWRSYRLPDAKPVHVEQWLKSLSLAPGSKAKIRNIMSAL